MNPCVIVLPVRPEGRGPRRIIGTACPQGQADVSLLCPELVASVTLRLLGCLLCVVPGFFRRRSAPLPCRLFSAVSLLAMSPLRRTRLRGSIASIPTHSRRWKASMSRPSRSSAWSTARSTDSFIPSIRTPVSSSRVITPRCANGSRAVTPVSASPLRQSTATSPSSRSSRVRPPTRGACAAAM